MQAVDTTNCNHHQALPLTSPHTAHPCLNSCKHHHLPRILKKNMSFLPARKTHHIHTYTNIVPAGRPRCWAHCTDRSLRLGTLNPVNTGTDVAHQQLAQGLRSDPQTAAADASVLAKGPNTVTVPHGAAQLSWGCYGIYSLPATKWFAHDP